MDSNIAKLMAAMIGYDHGDARRIHHLVKVHDFAATIAAAEGVDEDTTYVLEAAAIVHDIGIHISEQKYGCCDGKHQEQEGPAEARKLLQQTGCFSDAQIDRVCWLVGHHHTYSHVESIDHRILLEADFLVNVYEDNLSKKGAVNFRNNVFRTPTGISLLNAMLDLDADTTADCTDSH